jgi:CRP/FNR family cyclic AMP-dependent transcriptional regulator
MVKLTAETLRGVELLRSLGAEERGALAKRCRGRHYRAGEQILAYGETSSDVYFVVSGQVRATIYARSGKEVSFRDIGAGRMFGDLSAIDGKPRSASVVALSDALILTMPHEVFWEVLGAHRSAMQATLKELAGLIRRLSERIIEFSTLGVRNRIHAELLRLSREHMHGQNSAVIEPAPTHAEIASRVSTHREAVTRELNDLAAQGLIERRRGVLVVGDVGRLAEMVESVGPG